MLVAMVAGVGLVVAAALRSQRTPTPATEQGG
jgi:hypothetical protein